MFFSYREAMKNQLRLLVLTHNFPRREGDHAGVFIKLLLKHLIPHGIVPVVLAPHDPGAAEYEELDGIKVYRFRYADRDQDEDIAYRGNMQQIVLGSVGGVFKFKRFLDRWRRAALELIDNENIDIVSGHWLVPSGNVMKTIAAKTDLPMVMSSHGTDVRLMRKYAGATYRYFKSFCRGLYRWTVVSNYLRETILSFDPKLENILEVLPLPHNEVIFYNDSAIQRNPNVVVAVTRFTRQKRVDQLIKAFALVTESQPGAKLEIFGGGPLEHDIRELIDKFGVGEHVTVNKPVSQEELRRVYNRAGIVVLNSVEEGFGLALSEAMLCGAAAVGAASGGITDIIEHNKRGLLVEPDNVSALSDAILSLLKDPSLRDRLADAGEAFAREHYASKPLADRYAEIVKSAARVT